MISKDTIYIKNVYYMLSYAYRELDNPIYDKIQTENFDNVLDLLSGILIIGVSKQIKQGLIKDYIDFTENTSSIKGRINITDSFNSLSFIKKQLNCTYDEFSVNCYLNQIIKSTMNILVKSKINHKRKTKLKKLLMYFSDVDYIDFKSINWKNRFDRNNQTYKLLINICYMLINGLILSEKSGNIKVLGFEFEEKIMPNLYEKFVLNYYDREHHYLHPHALKINWQIDKGYDEFVPEMRSDVTLKYKNKILIIDTKFYGENTQKYHEKDTHRSGNLYQIFTYVKNKQIEVQENDFEVSGMLLYAMTDYYIQPNSNYVMSGNNISVRTLNLNKDFEIIKLQLDNIVDEYFGN